MYPSERKRSDPRKGNDMTARTPRKTTRTRTVSNKADLRPGTNYIAHHTRHGYSYEAVVIDKKGVKHPMKLTKSGYIDPVDLNNYIKEAQRGRSKEGVEIDLKIKAKKIFPAKPTPRQLVTYSKNPNQYDIEGFDAPKGSATVKATKPKLSRIEDDRNKQTDRNKKVKKSKETIDDVFADSDEAMWKKYSGTYNKKSKGGRNACKVKKKTVRRTKKTKK